MPRRWRAALLLALDEKTDAQIARELGISRRTLARWKKSEPIVAFLRACDEEWRRHSLVEYRRRNEARLREFYPRGGRR